MAGLLLAAITALICVQLVLSAAAPRLASPLTTVYLALFVWTTMLGIPAATRRRSHLSLVFLRRHVPAQWHVLLRAAWLAAAVAFFAALAVTGTRLCLAVAKWGDRFVGSACPDWVVTAAVPFAAALSCVRACEAWWTWAESPAEGGEA